MPTIASSTFAFNSSAAVRANETLTSDEIGGWVKQANSHFRKSVANGDGPVTAKAGAVKAANEWLKSERRKSAKPAQSKESIEPSLGDVIVEGVTYQRQELREWVGNRGAKITVNKEAGILGPVKILGLESKNLRKYSPVAVKEAMALYEGAKVNVNHPDPDKQNAPRLYEDRMGVLRGVYFVEGEGLYAKEYRYNPKHKLAEQLAWDAENAPENVGFSHNIVGHTRGPRGAAIVEKIETVNSVDLVADPATTRGLFESITTEEAAMPKDDLTLESLRKDHPALVEAILAEAAEKSAVQEATEQVKALEAKIAALESEKAATTRANKLRTLLAEAKLPDPSTDEGKAIFGDAVLEMIASASEDKLPAIVESLAKLRGEVHESSEGEVHESSEGEVPKSASGMTEGVAGGGKTSTLTTEAFVAQLRKGF